MFILCEYYPWKVAYEQFIRETLLSSGIGGENNPKNLTKPFYEAEKAEREIKVP